eukprot:SAG31_NODE_2211_length_6179_cov_2.919572_8_plen_139_part_00
MLYPIGWVRFMYLLLNWIHAASVWAGEFADVSMICRKMPRFLSVLLLRSRLPREQTLGEEARRRVPAEFRRQSPSVANPPTLMLLADAVAKAYDASSFDKFCFCTNEPLANSARHKTGIFIQRCPVAKTARDSTSRQC